MVHSYEKFNIGRLYRALAYWTLPPGIEFIVRGLTRKMLGNIQNAHATDDICRAIKKNIELRDRHQGKRCFILATGPSVRQQDLTVLKGELCIAVGQFYLHKDIQLIAPAYHVLAPYHHPFTFKEIRKVFDDFNRLYSDDITYLFGHYPYEFSIHIFLQQHPDYARKNSYYIDYTYSRPLDDENHLSPDVWNIAGTPFQIRTVVYSAIQAAIYMGCKEIYLIGCDHDYLYDMKRVTNHHFYKEEEGVSDVQHLSAFTSERWFEEYYYRWKQYRLMRMYAEAQGIRIINATKGGMLDVFPRIDLEDLF